METGNGVFHGLDGENGVVPRLSTGVVDGPGAEPPLVVVVVVGVVGCVTALVGALVVLVFVVGALVVVVFVVVARVAVAFVGAAVVVVGVDGFVPADDVLVVAVVLVGAAGRVGFVDVADDVGTRFADSLRRPLAWCLRFDASVSRWRGGRR